MELAEIKGPLLFTLLKSMGAAALSMGGGGALRGDSSVHVCGSAPVYFPVKLHKRVCECVFVCVFSTVRVHRNTFSNTRTRVTRSSVYYGMCFGSSRCAEGSMYYVRGHFLRVPLLRPVEGGIFLPRQIKTP